MKLFTTTNLQIVNPCIRLASASHFSTYPARLAATSSMSPSKPIHSPNARENEQPKELSQVDLPHSSARDLFKADEYHLSSGWKHPGFDVEQMHQVQVSHLQPKRISDRVAWRTLQFIRASFDFFTGYKHPPPDKAHEFDPKYNMDKGQWLKRFVFLESVAGVPGMVGGMVRHLQSLRLFKRDRAWIESLLEEAYNERMHLLTFIKLKDPGMLMRLMVLGAQGVFFNMFFVCYLVWPRVCHRFVGYLEEEAVVTYTRCIEDMEKGKLNEFANTPAPDIARKYWGMPDNATVKDLIYYVRADESKHREVNHTFGNLLQNADPNPYVLDYSRLPKSVPRPTKTLEGQIEHPVGWTRDDIKL